MTGAGMDELFEAIDAAAVEYNEYVEEGTTQFSPLLCLLIERGVPFARSRVAGSTNHI